jgi:hypothetical protein|tara:strand:+ start:1382 stop:2359 length:978 start_codon:yes stop_codon:yes gene_type:complete
MNKITITEDQLNLLDGSNQRMVKSLHEEYLHEFMKGDPYSDKNLIKKVGEQFGMDLTFMFTYGAGITALVGPTTELLSGEFPNLNEVQTIALLIAAVGVIVFGNKTEIINMVKTLKEEGLSKAFNKVLSFVSSFESLMENILRTAGMTVRGLSKIMGFAFIVPVITTLSEIMLNMGGNIDQIEDIVTRMLSYLGTISIGEAFASILEKLKSKFKKNSSMEEEFLREHFNSKGGKKSSRRFPDEMFDKFKKMFNKVLLTDEGGWGRQPNKVLMYVSPLGKVARIEMSSSSSIRNLPFKEFETYELQDFHDFAEDNGFEIEVEGKFK